MSRMWPTALRVNILAIAAVRMQYGCSDRQSSPQCRRRHDEGDHLKGMAMNVRTSTGATSWDNPAPNSNHAQTHSPIGNTWWVSQGETRSACIKVWHMEVAAKEVRMKRDGSMATKRRVRTSRTADAVPPSVVAHRFVVRVQIVRSFREYDGIRLSLPEIRNQNGVSLRCSRRNTCPSVEVRVDSTSVVTTRNFGRVDLARHGYATEERIGKCTHRLGLLLCQTNFDVLGTWQGFPKRVQR